jgi:ATP-dependent helicase HrpA
MRCARASWGIRCACGRAAHGAGAAPRAVIALASAPATWAAAAADIREQLDALVHPDFLRETSAAQLVELPRYLSAMRSVSTSCATGRARMQASRRRSGHTGSAIGASRRCPAGSTAGSALARFRWMIEELRVSLFAQSLGRGSASSPQRLEKQWETVRAELRAAG